MTDLSLSPAFSPNVTQYHAAVRLLTQRVQLLATPAPGNRVALRRPVTGASVAHNPQRTLQVELALELGDNRLELDVSNQAGETRTITVSIQRDAAPWREVQVLTAEHPVTDGFFGDYLTASDDVLYLNSERRGLLYRIAEGKWAYEQQVESLLSVELEWMYEAALSDDTLALVAEPVAGSETLYILTRDAKGGWELSSQYPAASQGTLRLRDDDLVLVTEQELRFFQRGAEGWHLSQTLAAPATNVGFAERPTYFDARGISLGEGVLVVGAPRDSSPATDVGGSPESDCDGQAEVCAHYSGAVFVFERDAGGAWQHTAYLKPPAPTPELRFGSATAVDADWLAVGTRTDGSVAMGFSQQGNASVCGAASASCLPESGAVFLFHRAQGDWQPAGSLKPMLSRAYDYFGDSLILQGDTLLVGAPGQDSAPGSAPDDSSAPDSGGVYAFLRGADGFRELGLHKLQSELTTFPFPAELGRAGDRLVVAANQAPFDDGEQTLVNAGRVFFLH